MIPMHDSRQTPLAYESKGDSKRRRRWVIVTGERREGIRFALWLIGLFVAGLAFWLLTSLLREGRKPHLLWRFDRPSDAKRISRRVRARRQESISQFLDAAARMRLS